MQSTDFADKGTIQDRPCRRGILPAGEKGRQRMVLETKRLLLREMRPDDFQALFLVLGDPETMWHYPYTFDGQHVRIHHFK